MSQGMKGKTGRLQRRKRYWINSFLH